MKSAASGRRLGPGFPGPFGLRVAFAPSSLQLHAVRGPKQPWSPQVPAGERAATRRGFAWAPSALESVFCRHPIRRRGLCQLRGGSVGGWEAVSQLESVGGRISFPNSGLEEVCPEA